MHRYRGVDIVVRVSRCDVAACDDRCEGVTVFECLIQMLNSVNWNQLPPESGFSLLGSFVDCDDAEEAALDAAEAAIDAALERPAMLWGEVGPRPVHLTVPTKSKQAAVAEGGVSHSDIVLTRHDAPSAIQ